MPTQLPETDLPACVVITLAAAKALSCYSVTPLAADDAPVSFTFDGSDDSLEWTELDWRTDEVFAANTTRTFPVVSTTAYKYYRLRVTETTGGTLLILSVDLFERIASIIGHGEAESEISQQHAQQLATIAAEADAAADLAAHCRVVFTATASSSRTCPLNLGTATGEGSGASFESALEALRQAKKQARENGSVALAECSTGNNGSPITIPHVGTASPYPSVKFVQGMAGTIDKVVVTLFLVSHQSPDDIHILLVSPDGTKVKLWQNAGGASPISPLIISFDDDAPGPIADAAAPIGIAYQPSIYPGPLATSMPAPAPSTPYNVLLSAFAGEDPNGYWALYVWDDLALFSGSIAGGFDLTITLV